MSTIELIPQRCYETPLRCSEGGVALIERNVNGQREWLVQWNDRWKAFFFVGGHREGTESFRDCVAREIHEELNIPPSDSHVAKTPSHRLCYRAQSKSSSQLTEYTMELFEAHPDREFLNAAERKPENTWLNAREIQRLETDGGQAVSVTTRFLLVLAGVLPPPP